MSGKRLPKLRKRKRATRKKQRREDQAEKELNTFLVEVDLADYCCACHGSGLAEEKP